ncbi:hypothetical protein D3C78_354320 [compost metagenome]
MQCPSCEHEAPQADFGNPLRCPACGAYYEKAIKLKLASGLQQEPESAPSPAPQQKGFRLTADHVQVATRGLDGVQPVVVVDIQMRFWSMMVFMVKWMLAAIPAAIVFLIIIVVLSTFMGTFFVSLLGLPK